MAKLLQDIDFIIGFISGVVLHFIMLVTRASIFPPRCNGGSCTEILLFDFPVSILYYAFDESKIIMMSLLIGSALWGFLFALLLRLIKKYFDRRG